LFVYYSVCLVYLSYQLLYQSISIFYRGAAAPCPPGCYTYMIMIIKMIEIYNIAAQPYYCWWIHAYCIEIITPRPTYIFIVWKEDASLPAMFMCNQSSHYENYRWFPLQMEAIMCLPQNQHFVVNKDEGGRGKSMKNTLYVQQYGKSTSRAEATSNSKKNQACSLSHCWVKASGR